MPNIHKTTFIAAAVAGFFATQALAISLGEFEYQNSCSQCHGTSGKGDGPVTDFLSGAAPSDLTMLQQNNGGVFPVNAVYTLIDGSMTEGVHGTRDMPMWGNRYRARSLDSPDYAFSPEATEAYVRTRILSLIEYLSTIQAE